VQSGPQVLTEASEKGIAGVLIVAGADAAQSWAPVLDPAVTLTAPLLGTLAGLLADAYPACCPAWP